MKKILFLLIFVMGCNNDFFYYSKGNAPTLSVIHSIMNETVNIYNDNSCGTGTILKKTNKNTYIITCAHVIQPPKENVKTIFDDFMFKISMIEFDNPFSRNNPFLGNKAFLNSIKKPIVIKKSTWIDGIQQVYSRTANIFVIDRTNDICILKINGDIPGQEIKIYKQIIPVGAEVYHVGNLLGYLNYSVLSGIISHNSRGIFGEKIQVDIRATFGCSGGGIFTKDKGEYVGMVSEKSKTSDATITISIKKILRWMEVYGIDKNF